VLFCPCIIVKLRNPAKDYHGCLVTKNQIYGEVIMRIPKLGYLQYFLATAYGWIIAVVVPCVGIIVYDILKLIKTIKNNNRSDKRKNRENQNEG